MFPSPKSHNHEVAFIELSVNATVRGVVPLVTFAVNAAIGIDTPDSSTVKVCSDHSEEFHEMYPLSSAVSVENVYPSR